MKKEIILLFLLCISVVYASSQTYPDFKIADKYYTQDYVSTWSETFNNLNFTEIVFTNQSTYIGGTYYGYSFPSSFEVGADTRVFMCGAGSGCGENSNPARILRVTNNLDSSYAIRLMPNSSIGWTIPMIVPGSTRPMLLTENSSLSFDCARGSNTDGGAMMFYSGEGNIGGGWFRMEMNSQFGSPGGCSLLNITGSTCPVYALSNRDDVSTNLSHFDISYTDLKTYCNVSDIVYGFYTITNMDGNFDTEYLDLDNVQWNNATFLDYCGDAICNNGETCGSTNVYPKCRLDCGLCPSGGGGGGGDYCGDRRCSAPETCGSCPDDCGDCVIQGICGDDLCLAPETNTTCPKDCLIEFCGDKICQASENELFCPDDCKVICGDGICQVNETVESCPEDCNIEECGDKICQASENTMTCPDDCEEKKLFFLFENFEFQTLIRQITALIREVRTYLSANPVLVIGIVGGAATLLYFSQAKPIRRKRK